MKISKKKQKAGRNSLQNQTDITNNNFGITEERTREIIKEMADSGAFVPTKEAYEKMAKRLDFFENIFISRINNVDGVHNAFGDPYFQFLLRDSIRAVGSTDEVDDYKLLSELLTCHIEKGQNPSIKASVKKAIDTIGMIDMTDLCALTVSHAVSKFVPEHGSCYEGLKRLDLFFSEIINQELPLGNEWQENLEILGAIRILPIGNLIKIADNYKDKLNGYTCIGINKESDDYKKAIRLLIEAGIDTDILMNHELLDGYVRLSVSQKDCIEKLYRQKEGKKVYIGEKEKEQLYEVWDLYSTDIELQKVVNKKFEEMWDSFENLRTISKWWDLIPEAFRITKVGSTLAHINAKRCDPTLPDLV